MCDGKSSIDVGGQSWLILKEEKKTDVKSTTSRTFLPLPTVVHSYGVEHRFENSFRAGKKLLMSFYLSVTKDSWEMTTFLQTMYICAWLILCPRLWFYAHDFLSLFFLSFQRHVISFEQQREKKIAEIYCNNVTK